jgi:transposase-like protein
MRNIIIAVLLFGSAARAQQVGQNRPTGGNETATFSAGTQLVIETVAVTDKTGKPVEGLTAQDFTVTENGAPQTIRFFEYHNLPDTAVTPITSTPPPANIKVYDRLTRVQISPESPGATRYKDRRLLALYFDMSRGDLSVSDLRAAAMRCEDGRAACRLLAIAMLLDGASRQEAAKACGMDRQTLRDWVHRYNEQGIPGLSDRRRSGRPSALSDEQKAELKELIIARTRSRTRRSCALALRRSAGGDC